MMRLVRMKNGGYKILDSSNREIKLDIKLICMADIFDAIYVSINGNYHYSKTTFDPVTRQANSLKELKWLIADKIFKQQQHISGLPKRYARKYYKLMEENNASTES